MAESVIAYVVETLGDFLIQKIVLLRGVENQVQQLKDELVRMKCFLKDADQKQDDDARIRNWVSEIRDASYDAEDVVELFVCKMESLKKKSTLIKLAYFPAKIHCLYKVGKKIQAIQSTIEGIKASRNTYGIKNLGEGTSANHGGNGDPDLHVLRRTFAHHEDKNTVGIEEKVKYHVSELLRQDSARRVVLITGMGGVGKTTLGRKIYNHTRVQKAFTCHAWVYVSGKFNFREIMKTIIKQVYNLELEKMDEKTGRKAMYKFLDKLEMKNDVELEQELYECLQGKRYLVVLDDIWQATDWDILSRVFPDEGNGSRLLLTTRNKSVAQHADPLPDTYELETLSTDESWLLFCKTAFPRGICAPHLEALGREIVSHCGGLPLAIATIGSLLVQKRGSQVEWEKVLHSLSSHVLNNGMDRVFPILELSYRDLHPDLKFCFKYLGFFPEDHEISVQKLTHLWIAEGIILRSEQGGRSLEDIAADYIEQLIDRNMVQLGKVNVEDKVKSCRLHDLLREVAIRKGRDENFLDISANGQTIPVTARYIAIHDDSKFSGNFTPRLRIILSFSLDIPNLKGIKLLRVLNLDGSRIDELPKEIGEMSLLRYLCLKGTGITTLPRSLSRLQHLQTLDVSSGKVDIVIPNVIWMLQSLRHLYVWHLGCEPLKIEGLKSLRTLVCVHYDMLVANNLMSLTNIQKLAIRIESTSQIGTLFASLSQLPSFRYLILIANSESDQLPSLDGIHAITHLNELKLVGKLNVLPHLPANLSRLALYSSKLKDNPMPMLSKLGQLSFLKMEKGVYPQKKLMIPANGFYQLNFLELKRMKRLKEVVIEEGALVQLKGFRIRSCKSLKMLPDELPSMACLQKLELVNMPEEFVDRVIGNGPDSHKVRGVPTLKIFNA